MAETKSDMSSLDIRFLIKELKAELIGGTFRKIYQYGGKSKQFVFELFVPGKGTKLLVEALKCRLEAHPFPIFRKQIANQIQVARKTGLYDFQGCRHGSEGVALSLSTEN